MGHTKDLTLEQHKLLEQSLSKWSSCEDIVSCSSGTAALHLALESLKLSVGCSVVIPDYTMVACARAVILAGLNPVFCDVNDSMLMDLDHLDSLLSNDDSIVAVMPVHLYGRRFPMDQLSVLRNKYGLYIIEDLAEAHGINPHWSADASCWSFYINKIVAGEEGGAVAFKSKYYSDVARSLRCLGFTSDKDYNHIPRGHNYRMSNAHASLILESLKSVEDNLQKRKDIEKVYDKIMPYEWQNVRAGVRDVVWVYDLRIRNLDKTKQDTIVKTLRYNGIEARHGFKPLSSLDEFRVIGRQQKKREEKCRLRGDDRQKTKKGVWNSTVLSREIIYLPVVPDVTTAEQVFKASELIYGILSGS